MKTILLILFLVFNTAVANNSDSLRIEDCKLKGKRLSGRVYVTASLSAADFKVKIYNSNPDLQVEIVSPSSTFAYCGQWYFTDSPSSADFSIVFVDSGEDFSISYKN
ncbi:MAG: hypothetical protein LBQ28_09165 [Prevotellaceae bacterium]|jgi:hypothetical protein|nr:hypothetical protein [Prevotellaceae bacterium]